MDSDNITCNFNNRNEIVGINMDLDKLKQMIVLHEGKKLWPYRCTAGKLTIGIGHNLEAKGISNAVADLMYEEDIKEVIDDLHIIFESFDNLPEQIQLVLADMRFQLGGYGFRKFKKMIKAVNNSNWKEMIVQMKDSRWYKQTRNRAIDLINLVMECL